MKILYLTSVSMIEHSGVSKKIDAQCEALKYLKNEIDLCYINRNNEFYISRELYKNGEYNILKKFKFSSKVLKKIYALYLIYNYKDVTNHIKKNNYEVIYIRYIYSSNIGFINFLKKIKKMNRNIKIIIEIPTYPYDDELLKSGFLNKIRFLQENYYRNYLKKYVNKVVTFSNDDEIFSIKTIKINNGIGIKEIIPNKKKEKRNNEINFMIVAQVAFWHGIDRFILSLAEYYKNNPKKIVNFHIIGDGDKRLVNELKKLVVDNNLKKYVTFYGYKSGKDLDEIYNKVDIAVGSLGFSRISLKEGSPLKTREYIAKGLPVILGYEDTSLPKKLEFTYQVSNDESVFDLYKIVKWYKNLKITSEQIRKFAEDNLTWNKQMKKVVDYILETEEKEKC